MKKYEIAHKFISDAMTAKFKILDMEFQSGVIYIGIVGDKGPTCTLHVCITDSAINVKNRGFASNVCASFLPKDYAFDKICGFGRNIPHDVDFDCAVLDGNVFAALDGMSLMDEIVNDTYVESKCKMIVRNTSDYGKRALEVCCRLYEQDVNGGHVYNYYISPVGYKKLLKMVYFVDNGYISVGTCLSLSEEVDERSFHCVLEYGEIKDDIKRRLAEIACAEIEQTYQNIEKF